MTAYDWECKRLFAEKANGYRLHLDKSRWLIAGAYLTAWGAVSNWSADGGWQLYLFMGLLGCGVFFVLCVQNWHYKMYSRYVRYCEDTLVDQNLPAKPYAAFSKENKNTNKVGHEAFSFVLVGVLTAAGFSFARVVKACLPVGYELVVPGSVVAWCLVPLLFLVCGICVTRHWNELGYEKILRFMNWIIDGKDERPKSSDARSGA